MQILSQLFERKTITEIALPRFFVPFPAFVFIDVLYRFTLSLIFFGCLSQRRAHRIWTDLLKRLLCLVCTQLLNPRPVEQHHTNPLMEFSSVNPVD